MDKKAIDEVEQEFGHQWLAGETFIITEFGERWLKNADGQEEMPTEFGRFSHLLRSHNQRLGDGYAVRSHEALVCYQSHAYFACCAMCGAAAESILLALAVEKKGDEVEVLKMYGGAQGKKKIQDFLMAGRNAHVQEQLPRFTDLLAEWRNDSAHGKSIGIGEEKAFTSLLLLLRFAQFACARWTELTT